MAPLNILIGSDSFREMRELHCCYVDKTSFIEEMFGTVPPKVSLITRPRRFGKTLMMTMLQEFFDIRAKERNLFEGLAISQNTRLCDAWMHQYPTLFLTLKGVEGRNFGLALGQMSEVLRSLCIEHAYLLESDKVTPPDKNTFSALYNGTDVEKDLANSLFVLCRALEAHHGKPVILFIDEYDVPINCAEQNGYYKEMIGFMRNMLGAVLKTNPSLKFAVLTGCLRIARESIFTGLNNFKCYGISDSRFADKFGFTSKEVDELLAAAGMPANKKDIREWYDGYRFGRETEMYCPWDVLQYIADLQDDPQTKPQAYWKNTSSNAIVRTLVEKSGPETRRKIEDLITGKSIEERLEEDMTYDMVYKKDRSLWTMMYLTGYLTKAARQPDDGDTTLVIPNKEVREIFINKVSSWFEDTLDIHALQPFIDAFWNGDADKVQKMLKQALYGTISYYDSVESFYHGFLAGLLRGAGADIRSNRENGLGRTDITMEDGLNNRAVIIEVKRAGHYDDLDKAADEALAQIEEKKYAADLPPQIKTVINYGISFWKKECAVKVLESGRP
ncbi:MAG: ATP-binding protein [Desulfovibrio sp.]|nr:ATP-binding protein [Desulfovibrio sp.]